MERLAALAALLFIFSAPSCKFQVTYPDSFAVSNDTGGNGDVGQDDLNNPDLRPDSVEPDLVLPDITQECQHDFDCPVPELVGPNCQKVACVDKTCQWVPMMDGSSCDDFDHCTVDDQCVAGLCGGEFKCDDGNPCTEDNCDSATGKCNWYEKPGCSSQCREAGEMLSTPSDVCCAELTTIPSCSSDWNACGTAPCPSTCCNHDIKICARLNDGVCEQPWETRCNSPDCEWVDKCTLDGGYCVNSDMAWAGPQSLCAPGEAVSELPCWDPNSVCCVQSGCIPEGGAGFDWQNCCDGTLNKIPQDLNEAAAIGVEPVWDEMPCNLAMDTFVCTRCGNYTCEARETFCNCPQDCPVVGPCYSDADCPAGGVCKDGMCINSPCGADGDCPPGEICFNNTCMACGIEMCFDAVDEDCDGFVGESLCQKNPCNYDKAVFVPTAFQFVLANPELYATKTISIIANVTMDAPKCLGTPIACTADLLLNDDDINTGVHIPLSGGVNIGCNGLTSSAMTCQPMKNGDKAVVWGKVVVQGSAYKFNYIGHCIQ